MSRRIGSKEAYERTPSDGTAARTRPLSIQDIMLHREKKAALETKKTKEGIQDNDNGNSNHLESERRYKSRKDLKHMPVEGYKKENIRDTPKEASKKDNLKDMQKEGAKKGSRKNDLRDTPSSKKDRRSIRDDNHFADKEKGILNSHKPSTSKSSRVNENKDGNRSETRARNGDMTRSESQKVPGKRWHDEMVDSDRIKERSDKQRNEAKRKNRGFDNEKSLEIDRPVLKKHDSVRFQDSKHFDRNDRRKEYMKPYHEEPRSKRRRSSSRDHDRERQDESSISLSPKEQRHNYRGHDENSLPYYSMDKSRGKYAETDSHRTSWNSGYGGGSYRKHGSRLGGYSPRKRKMELKAEQAIVKTPPPIVRSPEKKTATWDQPPAGENQPSLFSSFQPTVTQMASSFPVSFTALKQDPAATLETILAGNNAAIDPVQLTQATRPLRRLYVENLPSSATEKTLIDCLNNFLLSSGVNHIQGSKPCLSCTINKEKCQAFVEFLTPKDATAALSFDGRFFDGSILKIRRPKDYVETMHVAPKKPVEEIRVISDTVRDSPHKIFIAGISGAISSEMLMEIISAFGPLAAYRFLFNEELGGPCAFFEYIDHSITSKACAGLNGMKLGGCILTAVLAFPNPPEVDNDASPFYGMPTNAKPLLAEPTMVLQLKNVFDQEEFLLLSKSELEETLEDVRMECARFGAVKSINAVKYPASSDNITDGIIVEPKDGSVKTEAEAEGSILKQSEDAPDHSDPIAPQDVDPIPEDQDNKELAESLPSNAAILRECDASSIDQHADLDNTNSRAALPTLDQELVPEVSQSEDKRMEADDHTSAVDDGTLDKVHTDFMTSEISSSTTPGDEAKKSKRDNEQLDPDSSKVSEAESPTPDTKDDNLVSASDVFEPGSVLVEFMRKEATCMAAHSLHGRLFGNRTISAGYAPHDIYLLKYPK